MKKYHAKPSEAIITASRASAAASQKELDGKLRTAQGNLADRKRAAWQARCAAEQAAKEAYDRALRSATFDHDIAKSSAKGDHATARGMRIDIIERYRADGDEEAAQSDLLALIPRS